jgi:hypothetical protein
VAKLIRLEPYSHLHFEKMKLKEVYSHDVLEIPREAFATTFFIRDEPIAIFGAKQICRSNFQVWAFTTEDVKKHPIAFHREVLALIDFWFYRAQLNRMQMSVRVGYHEGWNWAQALGFKCEGIMKKYGTDGADHWLFARIANDGD